MKSRKSPIRIPTARVGDQPASRALLYAFKKELKSEIIASERRTEARLLKMNGEFVGLKGEFAGLKGEFAGLKGEFAELRAEFAELKTSVHRTNVLVEEQNSNNRIVLEGLQALWQRQDAFERQRGN